MLSLYFRLLLFDSYSLRGSASLLLVSANSWGVGSASSITTCSNSIINAFWKSTTQHNWRIQDCSQNHSCVRPCREMMISHRTLCFNLYFIKRDFPRWFIQVIIGDVSNQEWVVPIANMSGSYFGPEALQDDQLHVLHAVLIEYVRLMICSTWEIETTDNTATRVLKALTVRIAWPGEILSIIWIANMKDIHSIIWVQH